MLSLTACSGSSLPTPSSTGKVPLSTKITATIDGHIFTDGRTVYPNGGTVEQTASLIWTITYTARLTFHQTTHQLGVTDSEWKIVRMDGTVNWQGSPNLECSGNLSANPRALSMNLLPYIGVTPASLDSFVVDGAVPDDHIVVSSNTTPADVQCNTDIAVDYVQNGPAQSESTYADWNKLVHPHVTFDAKGGSVPFSFNHSGPVPNSPPGETVTLTDKASETVSLNVS
jgi:hypothetical protein